MLECEGYKMFRGTATVTPKNPAFPTEAISGTWLYKPEYDCWYVNGRSYTADIVSDFVEMKQTVGEWIGVGDRLPELEKEVLAFAVGKEYGFIGNTVIVLTKRYLFRLFPSSKGTEEWSSPWQYFLTDYKITHWMPLPAPPEDA